MVCETQEDDGVSNRKEPEELTEELDINSFTGPKTRLSGRDRWEGYTQMDQDTKSMVNIYLLRFYTERLLLERHIKDRGHLLTDELQRYTYSLTVEFELHRGVLELKVGVWTWRESEHVKSFTVTMSKTTSSILRCSTKTK